MSACGILPQRFSPPCMTASICWKRSSGPTGKALHHTRKISAVFVWLAFVAIGLTVVAPVVSRTLAAAAVSAAHTAPHSMHMTGQMPAGHEPPHAQALQSAHQHDSEQPGDGGMLMEQCGYCGLLGHSPLLMVIVWLPNLLTPPRPYVPVPPTLHRGPDRSTLTAAPRGPPAFLHC